MNIQAQNNIHSGLVVFSCGLTQELVVFSLATSSVWLSYSILCQILNSESFNMEHCSKFLELKKQYGLTEEDCDQSVLETHFRVPL